MTKPSQPQTTTTTQESETMPTTTTTTDPDTCQVAEIGPGHTVDMSAPAQESLRYGIDRYVAGVASRHALPVFVLMVGVRDGLLTLSESGRWGRGSLPVVAEMIAQHLAQTPVHAEDTPDTKAIENLLSKATRAVLATTPDALVKPETPKARKSDAILWRAAMGWVTMNGNPGTWAARNSETKQTKGDTLAKVVSNAMTRTEALGHTTSDLVMALVGNLPSVSDLIMALVGTLSADDLTDLVGTLGEIVG